MEEEELRQIREARMRELQKSGGAPGGGSSGSAPRQSDGKDEMKAAILSQICTQEARERLNRVAMVRPERAQQVEQLLIQTAQSGQLRQRVGEPEIVSLLNQISQREQQSNKLVFSRRETEENEEDDGLAGKSTNLAAANDDDDDFFD